MSKTLTIEELPPYGFTNSEWMYPVSTKIPPNMKIGGKPPDLATYRAWVQELAEELAQHVWPMRDSAKATWVGAARDTAMQLTQDDFVLLEDLKPTLYMPILGRANEAGTEFHHRWFFDVEDGYVIDPNSQPPAFKQWGQDHGKYDPSLPDDLTRKLFEDFNWDGTYASGELALQLKQYMQRPRAYQVAQLLGAFNYTYQFAHSAVSPALVNGHALQSTVAACHTYLKFKNDLAQYPGAAEYWAQFTVDVGDRRVFAGVHYPSDCIASWFCTLRLARHIFDDGADDARQFLWHAITNKSLVYAGIRQMIADDSDSSYAARLDWLAAEMGR